MKSLRLLLVHVSLLYLCACMTLLHPGGDWPAIGNDFLKQLRWGEYEAAAAFFAEEQQASLRAQTETRERLQIVEVKLDAWTPGDGEQKVATVMTLDYFRLPSATIRHATVRLQWAYRETGKGMPEGWRIVSPFPPLP
ncbi:MAG: hypothetical protein A2005_02290 [Desulfuromonadales bacterium GWC2_61_20]|nr:MAG: hypothetical protein A2005_02290 [Desulfuromonadales bacterium GWC2_61_20]HAD03431.1 hypothetical protein [Desulfuromonas sp.]HBT82074.1 hypothetical protein [Desulfuromonas sp.]